MNIISAHKEAASFGFLAQTVINQKYPDLDGRPQTWENIAERVVEAVMTPVNAPRSLKEALKQDIIQRKFIPGGRYLYAAGRPFHQCQNCVLFRAEDSREGWAGLLHKSAMSLMTGAGIGATYGAVRPRNTVITKTGGLATGPIALMGAVNEFGRRARQGGSRRSAIWAGLPWSHQDVQEFIRVKDWDEHTLEMKRRNYDYPAELDMTNVSVQYDDAFFAALDRGEGRPNEVFDANLRSALMNGEPGFSVDVGANSPVYEVANDGRLLYTLEGEDLRNAPVAADTRVLTLHGYKTVREIVNVPVTVWTGLRWAPNVRFTRTYEDAPIVKVMMTGGRVIRCEPSHEFLVERYHGAGEKRELTGLERVQAGKLQPDDILHVAMPYTVTSAFNHDAYGLGYAYGDGTFHGGSADITFCTAESKQCAEVVMAGGGISSVNRNDKRGYTRLYFKTDHARFDGRDKAVFPSEMFEDNNVLPSFIAGLFDADGNVEASQKRIRLASIHRAFLRDTALALEQLGILAHVSKAGHSTYGKKQTWQLVVASDSVQDFARLIPTQRLRPDVEGYKSYRKSAVKVLSVKDDGREDVFCADVKLPEHSFMAEGVIIANCTEITSQYDNDVCNIGSLVLPRIMDTRELAEVTERATAFLLAGTVYSDVPTEDIRRVRDKLRRLGLGCMGLHEWLLQRGKRYEEDEELGAWLQVYKEQSDAAATSYANTWSLPVPIKKRAFAPNGTIAIVGETTSSVEPILYVAHKRRFAKGDAWAYSYTIDPVAERLINDGVHPDDIETALTLATTPERRINFQVWVQRYVDHGISSTINLASWGSEHNNEGTVEKFKQALVPAMRSLRGITFYPDGARSGQPFQIVSYKDAIKERDAVHYQQGDVCEVTGKGTCG